MKRRDFIVRSLGTSAAAVVGASVLGTSQASAAAFGKRELYELRVYRLKSAGDSALLENYLEHAAIPALNRLGVKPVGVFKEIDAKAPAVFTLLPYASWDTFAEVTAGLPKDKKYLEAGAEYLKTSKSKPGFERIDSWFLLAFAGMPKLQLAPHSRNQVSTRLFELRTYESYSEEKAAKKVEMFNNGEVETMKEVGLAPVFFGQGLLGANLPHLTYMTSGENEEAHKQHWDAFGKHPTWVKLKDDPQDADTVSKMNKWMLAPTPYSQI
jgi:hypothetical protein